MIYKKFDTIPYKLLLEIVATNDVGLLAPDEDPAPPAEDLQTIWEEIHQEYMKRNTSTEEKKLIRLYKEIYYCEGKYQLILLYCQILSFDYDEEIINELRAFGYKITHEDYLKHLNRIEREAEGLLVKADTFKEHLPKVEEGANVSIDDIFASYTAILGVDLGDYNTVTAAKALALGKQVDNKIKAIQNNTSNGK